MTQYALTPSSKGELNATDILLAAAKRLGHIEAEGGRGAVRCLVKVYPPGLGVIEFHLVIKGDKGGLIVREQSGRERLPERCPDRHIEADGSFCLGLDEVSPANVDAAEHWWGRLCHFLELQSVVEDSGSWPRRFEWAHGRAGKLQKEAEQFAAQVGSRFLDAYKAGKLVLTGPMKQRTFRERAPSQLVNQRAACPCGAIANRSRYPVLRRDCKPHATAITELMRTQAALEAELNRMSKDVLPCSTCRRERHCAITHRVSV